MDINKIADICYAAYVKKGWGRDWSPGGCYLHLEVSEFIESLRGKGNTTIESEAGDVMFVFLSILGNYGVSLDDALKETKKVCDKILISVDANTYCPWCRVDLEYWPQGGCYVCETCQRYPRDGKWWRTCCDENHGHTYPSCVVECTLPKKGK